MGLNDEYLKLRKKRLEEEEKEEASSNKQLAPLFVNKTAALYNVSQKNKDIAPVKSTKKDTSKKKNEEEERKWFEKGAFEDGYQFGDVTKTILGTVTDTVENVGAGIIGMGEKLVDTAAYVAPYIAKGQFYQNGGAYMPLTQQKVFDEGIEATKKANAEFIKKDLYDEEKVAKKIISAPVKNITGIDAEEDSVFGEKTDALAQSGGQLLATAGLQAVGVPWFVTTGVTSFGGEVENAYKEGADHEEAGISAAISAGAEILTEKLSGGIKFGGKTLDDALVKQLSRGISNKTLRTMAKLGMDAVGEGSEEVISQVFSNLGSALYKEESVGELLTNEQAMDEYLESFIGGAVLGGVSGGINTVKSAKKGVDSVTGLTKNEQAVVDKLYKDRVAEEGTKGKSKAKIYDEILEDMEKGYISTDTIEEVLGGDTFKSYKDTIDNEEKLQQEYEELGKKQNATLAEQDRYAELKQQMQDIKENSKRSELKTKLGEEVFGLVQNDRLLESYNERGRKSQAFKADLTQYDTKYQETIKKAAESGILNDTRRTHEFVDMIAKISADKGVLFDFTNNEKLKNSGFAVDGKQVNGFVTKDGVTLNIDSAKSLNSVVGHEITHVLEGTELYDALQKAVIEYARGKNDYQSRVKALSEVYKDIEGADISKELTADLIGDYLFSDTDFINNLSTGNRNVFQKIYDEVKYLAKVATAGSKEARELERVKRAFENAYRESGKQSEGTKYHISKEFEAEIDKTLSNKLDKSNQVKARDFTPELLVNNGVKDLPMLITQNHVKTTVYSEAEAKKLGLPTGKNINYHGLGKDLLVKAVDNMDDPSAIYRKDADHYLIITELQNKAGEPIMIPVKIDGKGTYNDVYIDENQILSAYGKKNLQSYLENNDFELIYKKRETALNEGVQYSDIGDFSDDNVAQKDADVKYSLSDSEGKQLSPEQQEYFKDSKMRDDNGNLKVMYHGSTNAGFHVFDPKMSDDYISMFFVDRNDVAATYSGSGETYAAKAFRSAEDANNFFAEIGMPQYEVREKDGKYTLYDDGDEVATSESLSEIYDEFRDWEGVGYGDANYKVYLNLTNPLEVDAKGRNWNNISREYSQEIADRYHSLTAEEKAALADIAGWGEYGIFRDELLSAAKNARAGAAPTSLASAVEKLGGANANLYDAFSIASDNFSEEAIKQFAMKQMKTRDYAQRAKEQGYDGVIFKNIVDNGGYSNGSEGAATVAIAFDSEQIKSVANDKPTRDKDIRNSLSREGDQFAPVGRNDVFGRDIALEQDIAPVAEDIAPVAENIAPTVTEATVAENATVPDAELFPDNYAPTAEEEETYQSGRIASLDDADAPPEMEAPYYEDEAITADDPFADRQIEDIGNRKVKAYMYENPEVKPFFQAEARVMLSELGDSIKGERWYNDQLYYDTGGEHGWGGTRRYTSEDIAYLLDGGWGGKGYTYKQIQAGLNAIIEDNGKENNAVSKRIEFILNERLKNGYTDFRDGVEIPPDQDYIKLLNEKQINEYSAEAFERFMANADEYAPVAEESSVTADIAPMPMRDSAPSVTKAYEAITPKKEKEPKLAKATPVEQVRAKILTEEPESTKKQSGIWSVFKDNFVDKGTIFEKISLQTGNRELQARFKSIGRAESRAQWFMEHGNAATNSLKSIRETVESSGKTAEFYEYLYHLHNADRMSLEERFEGMENKPVIGYDVTADMSKETAAALEKANPEFKEYAQEVYGYMTHLRQMLVDGGVISEDTAKKWEKMYPHYVPVRRKGDDGLNINVALDTRRTGVNAPVKKATGGNRDILPLFDTMAMRTEQTFKAVAKNRFGVELKNMIGRPAESEAVDVDELIDSIDNNDELLQEGKNGKNPTFTVFENGEKVTFEIDDEMYDTMKPKNRAYAQINNSPISKVLQKANDIRRGLITEYNPAFMFTNPIKDIQDVLINSQHPARTYANIPKAISELWNKNGHWYQEYMENGGEQNTYFDDDTKTFAKEKGTLAKVIGFPLERISAANNFIERIPRMAEYIASREEGRSIDVAMLDAARVTTDFSAGGDVVKLLNRNGFTFLNASVQGATQQVRNVREAKYEGLKGWAKLAAKVTAAGLPALLLNHLLWDDDEDYAELSDYVKQNYYIVAKYGDGKFVRIPKGRTLAVIQDAFEQMENLVTGNDEVDLRTFGELVVSNLAPNNPLENNIIAPITQAAKNKAWYGDDLVPTRLQDLPAAEQFDESTDSVSRWLGEKLNISPYKINYILDQYSGGVGDAFLPMLTPEAEKGNKNALGNLIAPLRDKFTTDAVMNNQNVSDFYDTKDKLTVNANASGASDEDVLMSKYMNSMSSEIGKLYGEKREIQNSDLSDAEKYDAVREIQKQIIALTKESLNTYEDIRYEDDHAIIGDRYYKKNEEGEWQKLSDDQVTKYEVTSDAGDAPYASDGEHHYRWYEPGEDSESEAGWRKITDDQLDKQKEVTSALGITPEEYWGKKEEYDYAYEYPENYAVAKAVGGYDSYKAYTGELYDIKADKDANGKSITGSRKEKVADYINNLDADYYTKIILFKNEYNADDTYNYEIIDYLNGRDDISFEEMTIILKKLGFEVDAKGNISW